MGEKFAHEFELSHINFSSTNYDEIINYIQIKSSPKMFNYNHFKRAEIVSRDKNELNFLLMLTNHETDALHTFYEQASKLLTNANKTLNFFWLDV